MKRRRKTHRRGRTRLGRAALLDALLDEVIRLPDEPDLLFVDVGYGDRPLTTERTHEQLKKLSSHVRTIGVEVEESRVSRAQSQSRENVRFVLGGFDLPALGIENASLIRCLNVLRGYGLWEVKGALIQMARGLRTNGVLVEGTSDVEGTLSSVHLWKRGRGEHLDYQGLVCVTDFSRGFSPLMFRDVLPRDLRRHAKPGEPVFEWLSAWNECAGQVRATLREEDFSSQIDFNARVFLASAEHLEKERKDTNASFSARGVILWTPERPGTRPEVLSPDDGIHEVLQ